MLWIPGAKGLVGSTLAKLVPDALQTGSEVDISHRSAVEAFVKKHPKIDRIINCAAFSMVDAAEEHRNLAYAANVLGPENLGRLQIPWIHLSTDYVFPGDGNRPLVETDPTGPVNYYGQTKLLGEQRALALGACVVRTSWVFGPGGKNFVSKLLQLLKTEPQVRLTNDQWSRFTYAPDLAAALLKLPLKPNLFHYANRGVATKYDFALALSDRVIAVPSSFFPTQCRRPVYTAFNTAKIESFLSIRPWTEALKEFLCAS